MLVELNHNKIVSDTMTDGFKRSFESVLLPMLEEKYGDTLTAVQMYEDYIADGFLSEGEWYYPLTLVLDGECVTCWIKWEVDSESFKGGIPYSFVGEGDVGFEFAEEVPEAFTEALLGRSVYYDGNSVPVVVDAATGDPTFLCGKYSQTFIDMMAKAVTAEITKAMSVSGLEKTTTEIHLIFAPDTYMEHTSENVTYRRLLVSDKYCAARDFWIKWTRLDSAVAYSVSDIPEAGSVVFELGEDVTQKIREREYRFLVRSNVEKYHMAMGRKNITEWREIFKRAVKRGELEKVVSPVELSDHANEVSDKLTQILEGLGTTVASAPTENIVVASEKSDDDLAKALEMARAAVFGQYGDSSETDPDVSVTVSDTSGDTEPEFAVAPHEEAAEETETVDGDEFVELSGDYEDSDGEEEVVDSDEAADGEAEEDELLLIDSIEDEDTESEEEESEALIEITDEAEDTVTEAEDEAPVTEEITVEQEDEPTAPDKEPEVNVASVAEVARKEVEETIRKMHEDRIRAEIEAQIRYEMEQTARQKAEEEAEKLRREHRALIEENEKLAALARKAEEERLRAEAENLVKEEQRKIEEAKLRAQLEAQQRAEERERERIAEAAILQVEAQRRREEEERKRLEEEQNVARQQERAKELSRLEAERIAEAARINHEIEELRREKLALEAKAAAAVAPAPTPDEPEATENVPVPVAEPVEKKVSEEPEYTYVSRHARLLFRRPVDPNITKTIHEIIKKTMIERGKENVYIRIKADIPDVNTVDLDFVQIPEEEGELLVAIIQALGDGGLGISKAILN